jgi:hypothetical protein
MKAAKRYLWDVAVMLDEAVNVIFLAGNPHESISQHAAFSRQDGRRWGCVLCSVLDRISANHCANSIAGVNRAANSEG